MKVETNCDDTCDSEAIVFVQQQRDNAWIPDEQVFTQALCLYHFQIIKNDEQIKILHVEEF
jgi:hypothetical protein